MSSFIKCPIPTFTVISDEENVLVDTINNYGLVNLDVISLIYSQEVQFERIIKNKGTAVYILYKLIFKIISNKKDETLIWLLPDEKTVNKIKETILKKGTKVNNLHMEQRVILATVIPPQINDKRVGNSEK